MALIEVRSVRHTYGRAAPALTDVSLVLEDGEAYALLGPSGCGKSTLLNVISGLVRPESGSVFFDGREVTELDPSRRNIAQVFQFPVVYESMTVRENLAFPLRNRKLLRRQVEERVDLVASLLRLDAWLDHRASTLAPEHKQLVSLARGLVREDTAAVLFDEPLTVVDPQERWRIRRVLRQIQDRFRITMVYVTHDQLEALTFARTVLVMNEGGILQQGSPEELFARPAHRFVGHFIGSPGMNFLPAESNVAAVARLLSADTAAVLKRLGPGITVGVRPEHLEIQATGSSPRGTDTELTVGLSGIVARAVPWDGGQLVTVRTGDLEVAVRTAGRETVSTGEPVRVRAVAGSVVFFDEHGKRIEVSPG